ncbi:MAG: DUF4176 domain-containing protein [Clostridia bacterium]|nr:DUF4176 domain-containing protein [Clostridia bacterium]
MKSLLPLGSVVLLNEGKRRLMICGRMQKDVATGVDYDYSACLYPEGIINSKELFLFNNENIQKLFFIGFQDTEEFAFKKFITDEMNKGGKEEAE